ncbi:fungal trichothecene efflux pump-domain-containing protein [Clohesyomyces aquaticus]|uniref:Fungal trichothecene efflux pump-domain-containing protein n=1 Tax=Clohesyomyces aquaticus TaxID=1231657 RepID=A0A1Y1ZNE8_9PLEO|nr:fungal trichothecene efflux pump-domain-containing protein [Clohesyomyces aquaticus]
MSYRFSANFIKYLFCIPLAGFSPVVSKAFILYTGADWRSCYYRMIMVNFVSGALFFNFVSGALFFFFYYPRTFHGKFRNHTKLHICYALAIIWPTMVAVLCTNDGGASIYAVWLSSVPSIMINVGNIVGGFLSVPIGKTKIQCIVVLTIGGALLGAVSAATPDTKNMAVGLILVSTFCIMWNEQVCFSNAGIKLLDQSKIGTAVGAAGSIRSAISSVGQAGYLSVLTNRLSQTILAAFPPALINAGLPVSSVPGFLARLTSGTFDGVEGLTTGIISIGTRAYREANAQAYSAVFYSTIAFTGVAVILSIWSPNVDDKMHGKVLSRCIPLPQITG